MNRRFPLVLSLAFGAWLVAYWVSYGLVGPVPEVQGNRRLPEFPRLADALSPSGLQQAAAAAVEHSPLRYHALVARNRMVLGAAKQLQPVPLNPGNPAVSMGRDGWLFLQEEAVGPRTKREIQRTAERAVTLAEQVTSSGRRFCLMVVPDKSSVYPEQTGTMHGWADRHSRRMQLPGVMAQTFQNEPSVAGAWLPLWERFQIARSQEPQALYWKHDTHWTPTGMLIGIEALVTRLQPRLWDPSAVKPLGTSPHTGDLMHSFLLQSDTEHGPFFAIRRGGAEPMLLSAQTVPGYPLRPIERFRCDHPSVVPGRTVMMVDSFLEGAQPLVTPWFADLTIVPFNYTGSTVLADHLRACDTLVFTTVERFLSWRMGVWTRKHADWVAEALVRPR